MKPSVGRIVHYVSSFSGDHFAAIITSVKDGKVRLTIFAPGGSTSLPPAGGVEFDETGQKQESWHWPERVD